MNASVPDRGGANLHSERIYTRVFIPRQHCILKGTHWSCLGWNEMFHSYLTFTI